MATIDALNAEDWAGEMGDRWLRNLDRFESMLAPISVALFQQANYMPGQRVVDVGCGGGSTSVAIARLVAPQGSVVGVDISSALVAEAKRRALTPGIPMPALLLPMQPYCMSTHLSTACIHGLRIPCSLPIRLLPSATWEQC